MFVASGAYRVAIETINVLLLAGANVNQQSITGSTALIQGNQIVQH